VVTPLVSVPRLNLSASSVARCALPLLLVATSLQIVACSKQRPGERWVNDLKLRGVTSVDEGALEGGLATQETGWWPFASKHWLDGAALDKDLARIRAFYARRGFFRTKVKHKLRMRKDKVSADVVFEVVEGQSTAVRELRIEGLDGADERLRRLAGLGLAVGQRYDQARYGDAKGALLARLHRAGYAYAKVDGRVEIDRDARSAKVLLQASLGPQVKLGKAAFRGLGPLPEDKLQRQVDWQAGDAYTPDALARTRAALFNQQVFASVSLDLPSKPPQTERATLPVTIKVAPGKLRELRLGGGIGIERKRHELRLRGSWRIRNFLGGLRVLTVRLQPAFVSIPNLWDSQRTGFAATNDVKLEQPDFLSTRFLAYALVGYDLGVHEGYKWHGPRLQLGLDRAFFDGKLRGGVSWNLQFLDFFSIVQEAFQNAQTPLLNDFVDPYRLAWFEPFVQLDLRDNRLDPRAGFFASVRAELGFAVVGGDFDYAKFLPEARGYLPIFTKRLVLAVRALYGYMKALSERNNTPVTRRLFLGGPTSHRGFSFGRLSPMTNGVPLGGNASLLMSADLRLRIVKLAGNWLGFAAFLDAGDVTAQSADLELDNLHLATGGALSYKTPIGAIRIALGVRLTRVDDPEPSPDPGSRIAFHLTIGQAF
jgi:translocation and assembly module TamA